MAAPKKGRSHGAQSRPGRTLAFILIAMVALTGGMFLSGHTTPRLGIDLAGGTSITLKAKSEPGQKNAVNQTNMNTAVSIIERRVNGLGVTESEVQTQGSDNIIVNIPKGTNEAQAREQVGTTAQLYFRPVITVAAGAPTPEPSASPSGSGNGKATDKAADKATDKATDGGKGKASSTPTPTPTASATSQGRAVTDALKADTSPTPSASASASGKPTPRRAPPRTRPRPRCRRSSRTSTAPTRPPAARSPRASGPRTPPWRAARTRPASGRSTSSAPPR